MQFIIMVNMKIIQRRLSGNMKIGRNQLCPCGSGLKYKKCCLNKTKEDSKILDVDDIKYMEVNISKEPAKIIDFEKIN